MDVSILPALTSTYINNRHSIRGIRFSTNFHPLKVFHAYTYSTAGWLALQSVPLIAGPSMIVAMLAEETRPASCM